MTNTKQLNMLRENILESLQDIDLDRINGRMIRKKDIIRLSALLESFSVFSMELNSQSYINESKSFDSKYDKLVAEYRYTKKTLDILREGFNNPFDTDDNIASDAYDFMKDMYGNSSAKKIDVSSVRLWNPDVNDKIYYKNGRMNAGKYFGQNDVIERCPIRLLTNKELYSKTIRDFAFPIDIDGRVYAIPFGYASYYRDRKSSPSEPNATYEYDGTSPDDPIIKIIAIKPIKKGTEIVLDISDEEYYDNELTADTFRYPGNCSVMYSVKNFKFA